MCSGNPGLNNRLDQTLTTGVSLTWHWTEHLATEVGWQYNKTHSNSEFFCYDQHQIKMGMVFTF